MEKPGLKVDSVQVERLAAELAAFPRDLKSAIKSSLKSGTVSAMKRVVSKHYAIQPKKIDGTHRIDQQYKDTADMQSLQFEVIGRRLTLAHFNVTPFEHRAVQPMIEILKGQVAKASQRADSAGKMQTPFVMRVKNKKADGFDKNVFINISGRTSTGKQKLKSYRTVSVPQMLAYPAAADEVQQTMLDAFDKVLFQRIERRTGVMQENIVRGG